MNDLFAGLAPIKAKPRAQKRRAAPPIQAGVRIICPGHPEAYGPPPPVLLVTRDDGVKTHYHISIAVIDGVIEADGPHRCFLKLHGVVEPFLIWVPTSRVRELMPWLPLNGIPAEREPQLTESLS